MILLGLACVAIAAVAQEDLYGDTCRNAACGASMLQVRSSTESRYVIAASAEEEIVNMALLQDAAYKGTDVAGWVQLAGFEAVQVYSHEGVCVLAFHGTDEAADWADNVMVVGDVKDKQVIRDPQISLLLYSNSGIVVFGDCLVLLH
eukprot:3629092-Amphidinium_carterae.1